MALNGGFEQWIYPEIVACPTAQTSGCRGPGSFQTFWHAGLTSGSAWLIFIRKGE
jgi:hypothetical protein